MTVRAYNWKPGQREKVAERMRQRMADPIIADKMARAASRRMRAIHEAYKALKEKGLA